ncbi:hypothetical protein I317_00263 [Kwoniella heveanensis CBS 569]|nr:hypothetical protein I317_00263 [Kwoniella heveanensis CBS 569]
MSTVSPQPPPARDPPPVAPALAEPVKDNAASASELPSHPLATTNGVEESPKANAPPVPKVHIKALIISGQSRMLSFEPELTVGRMKELIWNSWPSDWTDPAQPPSPSYLRILHAGRILQDDSTLSSNNLPVTDTPNTPTVVHISVRSFSIRGEDTDPKKPGIIGRTTSHRSHRNDTDDTGGCKCIIM